MENEKINFFAIPVFSFIPGKYKKLIQEKPGKVFGSLLICFLIMYVISAASACAGLTRFGEDLRKECPDFSLANGTFTCEKSLNIDEGGYVFVIDDTIDTIDKDDVQQLIDEADEPVRGIIIMGSKNLVVYQPSSGIQEMPYTQLDEAFGNGGSVYLTKDSVINELIPIVKGFIVIVMLAAAFFAIGWHYFVCLILQLITYIAECIFKHPLDSQLRYRTTVLARFTSVAISWLLGIVAFSVPFVGKLLITVLFAFLAVYFMNKQEKAEEAFGYVEATPYIEANANAKSIADPIEDAYVVNTGNEPKAMDFFGTYSTEQSTEQSNTEQSNTEQSNAEQNGDAVNSMGNDSEGEQNL